MGNQKQKWTSEEEEALRAGVAKHGTGKWRNILNDPEFTPFLTNRSNIDLKDKWRNLSFSARVQGSKDKFRVPALARAQNSASAVSVAEDDFMDDTSKRPLHGKLAPEYNAMIFEALSTISNSNGSDISAIFSFIEQRHEVAQNFRKSLASKLKKLALQGDLEKVHNCYKIKDAAFGSKTPSPKPYDHRPNLCFDCCVTPKASKCGSIIPTETLKDAAMNAAYKMAEADNKSFVAAEAVKEAERVSKMAEDTESLLQLVTEIYEQCSRGKTIISA